MRLRVLDHIGDVPAAAWNALADAGNPFLRHEFLAALENGGCAVPAAGWHPHHLLALDDTGKAIGAVPLYAKDHSYGEHVFDWAWAEAYSRSGLRYYPKLIAAIPFSPVTGPRLLCGSAAHADVAQLLIEGARSLADTLSASSLHWLFTDATDNEHLQRRGFLLREDCQFHWHNRGYRDFDDFLSAFTADKRKKVKRERRQVRDAGITTEIVTGESIMVEHWDRCYDFHSETIRRYGAIPFLTRRFFHLLGDSMPDRVLLVLARRRGKYIAGAFNLVGPDAIYGRYWGCAEEIPGLHFETCYYAAIEYAIAHGITRIEGGAQGEHKLARGFDPVITHSAHWLRHPRFFGAVAEFLERERASVAAYKDDRQRHAPYKMEPQP
jgi:uncharacterized protein